MSHPFSTSFFQSLNEERSHAAVAMEERDAAQREAREAATKVSMTAVWRCDFVRADVLVYEPNDLADITLVVN